MIVIDRRVAQTFRAAIRRCIDGSASQADSVPVLLRQGRNGAMLHCRHADFAILSHLPGAAGKHVLALPAGSLRLIEAHSSEPVELTGFPNGKVSARWTERGEARTIDLPALEPENVPRPPQLPKEFAPLPKTFLTAMHEASATAAKQPTQYVLHRLLLRGKSGEVVASDSRQLLCWGGFQFPFRDDVIIPRTGVFGLAPFRDHEDVGIGRTDDHVAIRVGDWIFAFTIDKEGRFPDCAALLRQGSVLPSRLQLDPADAERFLNAVESNLRGAAAKERTVTLDLRSPPAAYLEDDGRYRRIDLPLSTASGKEVRICILLHQFLRLLQLQFQSFEVCHPDKPLRARDDTRTLLVMPHTLPAAEAFEPLAGADLVLANRSVPAPIAVPVAAPQLPTVVLPGNTPPLEGPTVGTFDVFGEVDGLRIGVAKAAEHAGRLLSAIWQLCKQPQVAQAVRRGWQALTSLTDKEEAIR